MRRRGACMAEIGTGLGFPVPLPRWPERGEMTVGDKATFQGSASPLAIAGAAAFWLWMDQAVFTSVLAGDAFYETAFLVMTLCTVVALPLLSRAFKGDTVFWPHCGAVAAVWGVAGALGGALLLAAGGTMALGMVGAVLCGVVFSWGNLLWGWVCVTQGHGRAIVHIASAWAVGLPFNLLLNVMPASVAGVLTCAFIPMSATLFAVLAACQEKPSLRIEPLRPHKVDVISPGAMAFGVDGRLLALILAFCCVFGLMYFQQQIGPGSVEIAGAQAVGIRGACAAVFLAAYLTVLHDHVSVLFKACFYVLVAGLVVMVVGLFAPAMGGLSGAMVSTGYCGFDILVWTMIAFHSYVSPNRPIKTVAVAMTCEQAGILIGVLIGKALGLAELDSSSASIVMMVLAMVALAVLVTYTEYGSRMWVLLVETSVNHELPGTAGGDVPALAQRFGLTKREAEVAALFLQGRSMSYIAEKTFVSENTIKTHVQHIYRKCGVHSKQELIDLVRGE